MIGIKEVEKENLHAYWKLHWEYLKRDLFPYISFGKKLNEEEENYFREREYRGAFENAMDHHPNKVHFIKFFQNQILVGCAHYIIYKSEDGKCLLCDYWLLPEFRKKGWVGLASMLFQTMLKMTMPLISKSTFLMKRIKNFGLI